MTSQRKDKLVIAEHGVITEEALLAYLNDELSPEQRHEVDRLLKDDPFAQDALEGMRATQDRGSVKASLSSVHKKVRERSGSKRETSIIPMHWSNYAYAAVILGVLLSVGFVLTMYLKRDTGSDMAVQTPPQEINTTQSETEKPKVEQAPVAAGIDTVAVTGNGMFASGTDDNNGQGTLANNGLAMDTATLKGSSNNGKTFTWTATDKNTVADKGKKDEKPSSTFTVTSTNANGSTAAYSTSSTSAPTTTNTNAKVADADKNTPVSMEEAMKSFNSGDYKNAGTQFDAILQQQPDNADALFFGGVSDYVQNDLKGSEKSFDKLLKNGKKYVDGSKWYKANILLKKGKKDEAKKLLEDLSNGKGSYTERAKKKLTEAGF